MSKDQKSWINPCGFENDMTDNCTQDKSSLDGIDRELEISLNKMKSLRESVKKAYPTVDWESLESLKYSFLELPEFNKIVGKGIYLQKPKQLLLLFPLSQKKLPQPISLRGPNNLDMEKESLMPMYPMLQRTLINEVPPQMILDLGGELASILLQ
ncbi:hypothetical protein NPIL_447712 [Nephila pilipes]|uniref:Uncharacterized protein n=1 Tax=Nephila pilipes TaxID=299642 RepID=A0A8X6N6P3_NEPPI|nr:hypothetical protein NPIL_447712 [Nephila pilipes]